MDTDIEARLTALEQDDTLATDQTLGLTSATGPTLGAPPPHAGPVTLTLADLPRVAVAETPSRIGADLEVLGRIGAGGMGVVDLAEQRGLRREVAIKRLHADDTPDDEADHALQALLREAMLVGRLEHPNIVPVHLLGVDDDGRPVLVMKRIEGVAWRALIHDADHPGWRSVRGDRLGFHLDVLMQLCRAVEFAHSRGVLHRDIKPDNVMIGEFGEVYLLDWGVGCRLETDEVVTTTIVGTPAYMAPEMIETGARLDARTDVFLLGATLHEALTGQPRHDGAGLRATLLAAMAAAPHTYDAGVPAELAELCNRCCAADPGARFDDAGALREALDDFLRHRASIALAERAREQQATVSAMLTGESDDTALYEVVGECRFAFEQALRDWPDNEDARRGLHQLLTSVVTFELARENLGAARTMLARIDPLPESLARDVAALERRLAERAREQTRLQALADDMDFTVSRAARNRVFGVALAVVAVAAPALIVGRMTGVLALNGTIILVPALVISGVMVVVGIRWRHVFLRNRINRQISGLVFVAGLSVCVNRLAGALTGQTVEDILRVDYLLLATIAAIATLVVHRLALGPAIIALTSYLVSTLVPSVALPVFMIAIVTSVAFVVVGRRILRQRQG